MLRQRLMRIAATVALCPAGPHYDYSPALSSAVPELLADHSDPCPTDQSSQTEGLAGNGMEAGKAKSAGSRVADLAAEIRDGNPSFPAGIRVGKPSISAGSGDDQPSISPSPREGRPAYQKDDGPEDFVQVDCPENHHRADCPMEELSAISGCGKHQL